jgi:hypothetical protein
MTTTTTMAMVQWATKLTMMATTATMAPTGDNDDGTGTMSDKVDDDGDDYGNGGYDDDIDGDGDTGNKVDDDGDNDNYGNGQRRRR